MKDLWFIRKSFLKRLMKEKTELKVIYKNMSASNT